MPENKEQISASTPEKNEDKKGKFWDTLRRFWERVKKNLKYIARETSRELSAFANKTVKGTQKFAHAFGRSAVRAALIAAVLTGFAKKETQSARDNEPPKATLTVGTLGMKVFKAEINNGDKSTDFDANMVLAQSAKEFVNKKVLSEEKQDALFEKNPIEKNASKSNVQLLGESSTPTPVEPAKDSKDSGNKGLLWRGVAVAGAAALAFAAGRSKARKKDGPRPEHAGSMSVADMAARSGKGPANRG